MGRFDGLIEAARLGGRVYNLTTDRDLQIVRGGTLYTLGPGMA